jgi:hypothetical protein
MLLKSAKILFLVSLICGVFGYWGAFTPDGNRVFDEMSGMIPYFLGFGLSFLCCIAALILLVIHYFQNLKTKRNSDY